VRCGAAGTLAAALALLAGCSSVAPRSSEPRPGPYVLVLGTAQDGGLPQIGCREACCTAARADPSRSRLVTALLVVDPRSGRRWLIDASPDLDRQVELARGHPPGREEQGPRPALFDGIFLTHAHIGHYLGLAWLGREVYGARDMPVHASERMGAFLRDNGPWSLLVESGAIRLAGLHPGEPVELAPDLSITPFAVPHRDEFSDTLGFVLRGPRRSVAYLPDIDKWERWGVPLAAWLEDVDLALVDGTFFDGGELPGRDMREIPHPFVVETLALLAEAPAELRGRVLFTHLNHTNPLADPASAASARVRAAGLGVATDGQVLDL
jgi:pyrroloquinoline quinone biosynthesis protein B